MIPTTTTPPRERQGDFPAAHSMDTTWFAVDRDGCIGRFFSDENGQIPSKVFDPLTNLIRSTPVDTLVVTPADFRYLSAGYHLPADDMADFLLRQLLAGASEELFVASRNRPCHLDLQDVYRAEQVLLFPANEAIRLKLIQDERFLPIPDDPKGIISEMLSIELHESLHRDGSCHSCFAANTETLGLFEFDHDSGFNGTYIRTRCPHRPGNIRQIREPYRQLFQLVHFDKPGFEEVGEIQPLEFEPCISWGSNAPEHNLWWVAWYDHQAHAIKPIRGKEQEYAAHYEEICGWAKTQEPWIPRSSGQETKVNIVPPHDFPAAHSMDTTWFAVDCNGQVGAFVTGASGPAPSSSFVLPYAIFDEEDWVGMHLELQQRLAIDRWDDPGSVDWFDSQVFSGTLASTSDAELVTVNKVWVFHSLKDSLLQLCHESDGIVLQNSPPAVYFGKLRAGQVAEILRTGTVRGYFKVPMLCGEDFDQYGLFIYKYEYWDPADREVPLSIADIHPYRQIRQGSVATCLASLPLSVQNIFSQNTLDIDFATARWIQPYDFWNALRCWYDLDSSYLTSNLNVVKSIPGRENEYRKRYPMLRDRVARLGVSIEIVPPPEVEGDYPAAHSGDVEWFAVDAEDNVAVFFSSETSALPDVDMAERIRVRNEFLPPEDKAYLIQHEQDNANVGYDYSTEFLVAHVYRESHQIMRDFEKLPIDCLAIGYEIEDCVHPWNIDWYGEFDDNKGVMLADVLDHPILGAWVLLLNDQDTIRVELESGVAWLPPQHRFGTYLVSSFTNLPSARARRLLLAGNCLGAKRDLQPIHICGGYGRPEWTGRGLFAYVVTERRGDTSRGKYEWTHSHQYFRDLYPVAPLKSTSLDPKLRRIIERNRFPFSFATASFIQPELYFPCHRDTDEFRYVEFNGTPTPRLLALPSFHEFVKQIETEREESIAEVKLRAANSDLGNAYPNS